MRRRLFGFGSGFGGACAYAKQGRSCQLSNINWHMIRGQVSLMGGTLFSSRYL